jgi:phage terminase large subunit-like protein
VARAGPERWARAVAETAEHWNADRVVAEANQGGAMVESVLRAASIALPLRLVHATRGKSARPSRSPPSMNQAGCAIAANLPHWRTSCVA